MRLLKTVTVSFMLTACSQAFHSAEYNDPARTGVQANPNDPNADLQADSAESAKAQMERRLKELHDGQRSSTNGPTNGSSTKPPAVPAEESPTNTDTTPTARARTVPSPAPLPTQVSSANHTNNTKGAKSRTNGHEQKAATPQREEIHARFLTQNIDGLDPTSTLRALLGPGKTAGDKDQDLQTLNIGKVDLHLAQQVSEYSSPEDYSADGTLELAVDSPTGEQKTYVLEFKSLSYILKNDHEYEGKLRDTKGHLFHLHLTRSQNGTRSGYLSLYINGEPQRILDLMEER